MDETRIKARKKIFDDTYRIKVEVLEGGKLPSKVRQSDAGFDLYATSDIAIYPGQIVKHPLNIRLELPMNTWAEITTKSGLGSKGQLVYAGVIDEEYRGIPHVIMTNLRMRKQSETIPLHQDGSPFLVDNDEPIIIKKGEKVAQLIMNPYNSFFYIEQVDSVNTETSRGEGGFGSTGKS